MLLKHSRRSIAIGIYRLSGRKSYKLMGSEFRDKVCKVIGKKDVRIRVGSTHKHQSIVERFNRTLAERLFQIQDAMEFITEIENTAWVKNLQDIVDNLNNSITRLISMRPVTAILKDEVFALPSKIPKHKLVGEDEECLPSGILVRYL